MGYTPYNYTYPPCRPTYSVKALKAIGGNTQPYAIAIRLQHTAVYKCFD